MIFLKSLPYKQQLKRFTLRRQKLSSKSPKTTNIARNFAQPFLSTYRLISVQNLSASKVPNPYIKEIKVNYIHWEIDELWKWIFLDSKSYKNSKKD